MINRKIKLFNIYAGAIGFFLILSFTISADTIIYSIDSPNTALSSYTGPYASVSVNLTAPTTATVTFSSLNNGGYTYLMGAVNAADVNVNSTSWSVSSLTATNSIAGFSPGPLSNGGSGNVSSFGTLNQTINSSAGFTSASTQISFALTDLSGTWSSAGNVLTPNSSGFLAAIHGFACGDTCTVAEGAATTGFAGNSGVAAPEPTTYLLLGSLAFFGIVLKARRNIVQTL